MIEEKGSFRDPAGKIYYKDNRVFRKLSVDGVKRFQELKDSNIITLSIKEGFLIGTKETHDQIIEKSNQELFEKIIKIDDGLLADFSKEYILKVIGLVKERATFESDLISEGRAFFADSIDFDERAVNKKWRKEFIPHLLELSARLGELGDFNCSAIEETFHEYLDSANMGKV